MASAIPHELTEQLLADPSVQQIIKEQAIRSGRDAAQCLKDPAVQAQIMSTCQEKFPEYAAIAKDRIVQFCSDPEVQQRARAYSALAVHYAGQAGALFVAQVEQGPAGLRVLGFIAALASCTMSTLGILNPFGLLTGTIKYVLSVYQVMFSLTTMLFEAKPEWIQRLGGGIERYQDMLLLKSKFLADEIGRGLFYVFQGSLWLSFASIIDLPDLALGAFMVFIGFLNVLAHYGGYSTFADKLSQSYRDATLQPPS